MTKLDHDTHGISPFQFPRGKAYAGVAPATSGRIGGIARQPRSESPIKYAVSKGSKKLTARKSERGLWFPGLVYGLSDFSLANREAASVAALPLRVEPLPPGHGNSRPVAKYTAAGRARFAASRGRNSDPSCVAYEGLSSCTVTYLLASRVRPKSNDENRHALTKLSVERSARFARSFGPSKLPRMSARSSAPANDTPRAFLPANSRLPQNSSRPLSRKSQSDIRPASSEVERLLCKQRVGDSIPSLGSIISASAETRGGVEGHARTCDALTASPSGDVTQAASGTSLPQKRVRKEAGIKPGPRETKA